MKPTLILQITSLLSILLMTLHFTSDTLRARAGSSEAGGVTLLGVPILVLWLYGTLILGDRRSGHIFMLVGSLLAIAMPVMHVNWPEGMFHGTLAGSSGPFVFVWTLHALALTGMFSLILSVRGLLSIGRPVRGSTDVSETEHLAMR